jgi:cobalt-zinc-cadmium efflux system membrane fusion protein
LPALDPATRVATWIADVEGAPPGLRTGAKVVLVVRAGKPRTAVAVPREAVVDINTRPVVFVQSDGEHFEKRAVTVGDADGPFIEIRSGVAKGERVVTRGGFDIHLASLMGTVESHRH